MSENTLIYYCWMRVLPATGESTTAGVQQRTPGDFVLRMFAGPRPPKVGSTSSKFARPLPAYEEYWYADEEYHGDPGSDSVIDYGPAFVNRCEAIDWLSGVDGRTWVAESTNYLLFTFELGSIASQTQAEAAA